MNVRIDFDGKHYKVYYLPIDDFETDLNEIGFFLDGLADAKEEALAIVPNTGFVKSSIIMGMGSFQGVKGVAVVVRKLV